MEKKISNNFEQKLIDFFIIEEKKLYYKWMKVQMKQKDSSLYCMGDGSFRILFKIIILNRELLFDRNN